MKTTVTVATLILGLSTAMTMAATNETTNTPAASPVKTGPRVDLVPGPEAATEIPPPFKRMQVLQKTIRAKETVVRKNFPDDVKKIDDEIKALAQKKRALFAQKDPELQPLYDELDALMAKMRMRGNAPPGMKPVAPPPPPAAAVPAAAK